MLRRQLRGHDAGASAASTAARVAAHRRSRDRVFRRREAEALLGAGSEPRRSWRRLLVRKFSVPYIPNFFPTRGFSTPGACRSTRIIPAPAPGYVSAFAASAIPALLVRSAIASCIVPRRYPPLPAAATSRRCHRPPRRCPPRPRPPQPAAARRCHRRTSARPAAATPATARQTLSPKGGGRGIAPSIGWRPRRPTAP